MVSTFQPVISLSPTGMGGVADRSFHDIIRMLMGVDSSSLLASRTDSFL